MRRRLERRRLDDDGCKRSDDLSVASLVVVAAAVVVVADRAACLQHQMTDDKSPDLKQISSYVKSPCVHSRAVSITLSDTTNF